MKFVVYLGHRHFADLFQACALSSLVTFRDRRLREQIGFHKLFKAEFAFGFDDKRSGFEITVSLKS